jgi:TonB family protein
MSQSSVVSPHSLKEGIVRSSILSSIAPLGVSVVLHGALLIGLVSLVKNSSLLTELGEIQLSQSGGGEPVMWVSLNSGTPSSVEAPLYEESHESVSYREDSLSDTDLSETANLLSTKFTTPLEDLGVESVENVNQSFHAHQFDTTRVKEQPLKKEAKPRLDRSAIRKIDRPALDNSKKIPLREIQEPMIVSNKGDGAGMGLSEVAKPMGAPGDENGPSELSSLKSPHHVSYRQSLGEWIARYTFYPRQARLLGEEGVVNMRIVIQRDGTVSSHAIVKSSGHDLLDDAALTMVRKASPFPAVPDTIFGHQIAFTVPVRFIIS